MNIRIKSLIIFVICSVSGCYVFGEPISPEEALKRIDDTYYAKKNVSSFSKFKSIDAKPRIK